MTTPREPAPSEKHEKDSSTQRYGISVFDTPFSCLPNPKRVWLGSPSSALEGLGSFPSHRPFDHAQTLYRQLLTHPAGRLSLLTPEIVSAAAASEIKTGRRVGLGWDMTKLEYSQFGRQKCGHQIIPLNGPGGSGYGACFDDAYSMNPRSLHSLLATISFLRLARGHRWPQHVSWKKTWGVFFFKTSIGLTLIIG